MRIAQVSPLYESVPPKLYGGTERIVSFITEELVRRGHDVTLFASGDSVTTAKLVAGSPQALRLDGGYLTPTIYNTLLLEKVAQRASEFDLIHFHIDYLHFPISRILDGAQLTTLHGRLDIPGLDLIYDEYPDMPLVSISHSQRSPLPDANWLGTVYHGMPGDLYRPNYAPGRYLAFLGRISPEKRVDRAIETAARAGMEIRIGAKVDPTEREYFEKEMKPYFQHPVVNYLGEVGEGQKNALLAGASALLFPIDWEEPFGLVMLEALACGTPVIAWPRGSVPEVLEEGVTGFLVNSIDEAVQAVKKIGQLDRRACRREFERRFLVERMVDDYLKLYERVVNQRYGSPLRLRRATTR